MLDTIAMAKKLNGNYRKVFEKADMYSSISSKDTDVADDKMMNLYDLLMEAQNNDKPVEKIVGNDIEAFCKAYFLAEEEEKEMWYIKIPKVLYTTSLWITIIPLMWIIFPEEDQTFQALSINIFPYFIGLFVGIVTSVILKYVLEPIIFKSKKMKPITFYFIILIEFLGSFFLSITYMSDVFVMNIPAIWILAIFWGYDLVYLLVRSIWRYRTYGTIRKDTKENRMRKKEEKTVKKLFNDEVSNESSNNLTAKFMTKRYFRLNKRKMRRKQQELSFGEFAEIIRKEERMSGKINRIMALLFAAFVIGSTVAQMISTGFVVGLLYGVIVAVVEACIYRFTKSCVDSGSKQRLQIIDECERLGVSIAEYVNNNSIV